MLNQEIKQTDELNERTKLTPWLTNFINIYQQLSTENLHLLADIYHQEVVFIDPMHQLKGLENLHNYFNKLFLQLSYCHFNIEQVIEQGDEAAVYWTMHYQHPRLNSGKVVSVCGSSHIKGCGDKVVFHRDYLDLGAMLYEQLPVLGRIITWLKHRASQ
jgi:ketosteroid isomerase-like protein